MSPNLSSSIWLEISLQLLVYVAVAIGSGRTMQLKYYHAILDGIAFHIIIGFIVKWGEEKDEES